MNTDLACTTTSSPIGPLWLSASQYGLRRVTFGVGDTYSPGPDAAAHLRLAMRQLDEYFAGDRRVFDVPLDWSLSRGWARDVLEVLFDKMAYGDTISYAGLAALSGRAKAAQAVGGVMAANPIPVVVPCHRVIAADGGLGGFAGSGGAAVETKRRLLAMEGAMPPTLFDV